MVSPPPRGHTEVQGGGLLGSQSSCLTQCLWTEEVRGTVPKMPSSPMGHRGGGACPIRCPSIMGSRPMLLLLLLTASNSLPGTHPPWLPKGEGRHLSSKTSRPLPPPRAPSFLPGSLLPWQQREHGLQQVGQLLWLATLAPALLPGVCGGEGLVEGGARVARLPKRPLQWAVLPPQLSLRARGRVPGLLLT